MSLRSLGPVGISEHFEPSFSWTSEVGANGRRAASIGGELSWQQARQLSELVASGGASGVREYVHFDDDLLGDLSGWYLFKSFRLDPDQVTSLNGAEGPVKFSLEAVHLGNVQPVIERSARELPNAHTIQARSVVASPTWVDTVDAPADAFVIAPGGTAFFRVADASRTPPTTATGTPVRMGLYAADLNGSDGLASVVLPAWSTRRIEDRGLDVWAWDRREARQVGEAHTFKTPTDIVLVNGFLRLWVGPRGFLPYVTVEALDEDGIWRQEGCLVVSSWLSDDTLIGARLVSLTDEEGVIALSTRKVGEAYLILRRGERMVRIIHGSDRAPRVSSNRRVEWRGAPPHISLDGVSSVAGTFGQGWLFAGSDVASWPWPIDQTKDRWSYAARWKPTAASATQGDSVLLRINDSTIENGAVEYVTASDRIQFKLGTQTLQSDPITFAAGGDVFVAASFDVASGMALTVRAAGTTQHKSNATFTDPSTDAANYAAFTIGPAGGGFGGDPYGNGPFGGASSGAGPEGVIDNAMLFEDFLTETERAALALSSTALGSLPQPDARRIWYLPADVTPIPLGGELLTGRRFQATTEGGGVSSVDAWGMTKGLGGIGAVTAVSPFGIEATGSRVHFGAWLSTDNDEDDAPDYHSQLMAQSRNQLTVRR